MFARAQDIRSQANLDTDVSLADHTTRCLVQESGMTKALRLTGQQLIRVFFSVLGRLQREVSWRAQGLLYILATSAICNVTPNPASFAALKYFCKIVMSPACKDLSIQ